MTREQQKKLNKGYPLSVNALLDELTDKIFDELECRTCKNCKHFKQVTGIDYCDNSELEMVLITKEEDNMLMMVSPEFGCNEWENKDA